VSVKPLRCNRSRTCHCCEKQKVRIQKPAPKPDDPDYKVAVCPICDILGV
jgi:hypothetical protein